MNTILSPHLAVPPDRFREQTNYISMTQVIIASARLVSHWDYASMHFVQAQGTLSHSTWRSRRSLVRLGSLSRLAGGWYELRRQAWICSGSLSLVHTS